MRNSILTAFALVALLWTALASDSRTTNSIATGRCPRLTLEITEHLGGSALDVAVQDELVYVAFGHELVYHALSVVSPQRHRHAKPHV